MKKLIKAARNDDVIISSDMFELVSTSGIGIDNTPWTGYDVISKGSASDLVVRLGLDSRMVDWDSWEEGDPPIANNYTGIYLSWGFGSHGHPDPRVMVEVLEEAMDFGAKVASQLNIKTINF